MIGFAAFVVNLIIVIMRPQIDFNSYPYSSLVVRLATRPESRINNIWRFYFSAIHIQYAASSLQWLIPG